MQGYTCKPEKWYQVFAVAQCMGIVYQGFAIGYSSLFGSSIFNCSTLLILEDWVLKSVKMQELLVLTFDINEKALKLKNANK